MAIIKFVPQKKGGNLKYLSEYLTQDEKTVNKQISEYDCSKDTIKEDFEGVKNLYNKLEGRQYVHMVQSFKPDEVSAKEAHNIGQEMKNRIFKGYQVLLVTHEDKGHIHNHFVVNSVNMEDGYKWHQDAKKLYSIRSINDELCNEHSLSVPEQNKNRYIDMKELRTAERGESWKFRLMTEIDHARDISVTKNEFVENMKSRGYEINWTDSRKYITYKTPDGMKCRDSKLPSEYSKEAMENGFRGSQRQEQTARVEEERGINISGYNKRDSKEGSKDNVRGNDRETEYRNVDISSGEVEGVKRKPTERNEKGFGGILEGKTGNGKYSKRLSKSDNEYEESTIKDYDNISRDSKGDTTDFESRNSNDKRGIEGDTERESILEAIINITRNSVSASSRANNQRDKIERDNKVEKTNKKSRGSELEFGGR